MSRPMPDNTPRWEAAAIKVLKDVYGMGRDDERLGTDDFGTLLPGIRAALNQAVKQHIIGEDDVQEYIANGKDKQLIRDDLRAEQRKAIDGKAE